MMATNIHNINQSVRYLDLMLHWWWRRRRVTTLIPASWMICDWWRGWRLSRWPHWRWSWRPLNWWCWSRPCPASCCPWALLKWTIIRLLCWATADWRNRCTLMIWSIATQLWLEFEKNRKLLHNFKDWLGILYHFLKLLFKYSYLYIVLATSMF